MRRRTTVVSWLTAVLVPAPSIAVALPSFTVPLKIVGAIPVLTARVDGTTFLLMFDLRSSFPVSLLKKAFAEVKPIAIEKTQKFHDMKGNVIQSTMFKVRRIEIGGAIFTNVELETKHLAFLACAPHWRSLRALPCDHSAVQKALRYFPPSEHRHRSSGTG